MNTYTGGRRLPQEQHNYAEQRHRDVDSQAARGGARDGRADWPFPNKPVYHRRALNPELRDSLELYDFEKITISAQTRGPSSSSSQEDHSSDIRKATGGQHPRKDSPKLPSREAQLAREIHAKELMLQEKLWRAEDKIIQKIQRDRNAAAAAASDDQQFGDDKHYRGQVKSGNAQMKTKQREPVRSREMLKHERTPEDAKEPRKTNKDRIRNPHEEQGVRWRESEQSPQCTRNGNKGHHESTAHVHEVSGETNRRKGQAEKGERYQTAAECDVWTKEKKHEERNKVNSSHDEEDDDLDMSHRSQQKTIHRTLVAEKNRGAKCKTEESSFPPIFSPSHSSTLADGGDGGGQLLPCCVCGRKFLRERLEKHVKVCEKLKQSKRKVFNSYVNRTKGSANEEFLKTHVRSKTPEIIKRKTQRRR